MDEELLHLLQKRHPMFDPDHAKLQAVLEQYAPGPSDTFFRIHLNDVLHELNDTKTRLVEMTTCHTRLTTENMQLQTKLESLSGVRSLVEKLTQDNEILRCTVAVLESDNAKLKSQRHQGVSELEDLKETVVALRRSQTVIKDECAEKETLLSQVNALQYKIDSVQAVQDETIQRRLSEERIEMEEALNATLQTMMEQQDQLEAMHQEALLTCHEKDITIADLQESLANAKRDCAILGEEVKIQAAVVESHQVTIDNQTMRIGELKAEVHEALMVDMPSMSFVNPSDNSTFVKQPVQSSPPSASPRVSRWKFPGFGRKTHPLYTSSTTTTATTTTDPLDEVDLSDASHLDAKKKRICITVSGGGTAHYTGPLNRDRYPEGMGTIRYESGDTYVGRVETMRDGRTIRSGSGTLYYGPSCTQHKRGFFRDDRLVDQKKSKADNNNTDGQTKLLDALFTRHVIQV